MAKPTEQMPIALIVIDNSYKSNLIYKALKHSFSIFEIQESFSAVDWLKHFQASLIILDEAILTKTWPLLVQHIRQLPGYAHVPILLISPNIKKAFLAQALNYGITDFLSEPLDPEELDRRVLVNTKIFPVSKKVSTLTPKISRPSLQKPEFSFTKHFLVTEEVIKHISQLRTHQKPLIFILIEVDKFQEIKQKYSSSFIEELLATLTAMFKAHLRKQDFFLPQTNARFLFILPNTSQRAAALIAEMMHKEVESKTFSLAPAANNFLSVTLSIGLTAFNTDPHISIYDQFDIFLNKVDRALIQAKKKDNTLISIKKRNSE